MHSLFLSSSNNALCDCYHQLIKHHILIFAKRRLEHDYKVRNSSQTSEEDADEYGNWT